MHHSQDTMINDFDSNRADHLVLRFPGSDPGPIRCIGFSLNEHQRRGIIGDIEKWISRQQRLLFLPKESSFFLTLEKHGSEQYSAVLDVRVSSKRWLGSSTSSDPLQALRSAITELVIANCSSELSKLDWQDWPPTERTAIAC